MGSPDRGRTENVQARRVQALSIAMHVTLVVLIAAPMLTDFAGRSSGAASRKQWVRFELPAGIRRLTEPGGKPALIRGGGSGGDQEAAPASAGRLALFSHLVFTPPTVKPPLDTRLAMTPNLLGPPELHPPSPDMANWGNPLAPLLTDSSGPGHGGGIGTHCCGGVGDGDQGAGYGPGDTSSWGTSHPRAGKDGYGNLVCVYCPQPNFSREAVEAKIQGSIFIEAVILRDGRPSQIRVVRGLGYGLDENAIEMVRKWRFKPATGPDGSAADVRMVIELAFRLY